MTSIFRQYTFDDSFLQVFVSKQFIKEYQIALTFAADYDENGAPTNGVFRPTFDQTKVNPQSIAKFKKDHGDVSVKVFLAIGNKGEKFPFNPKDTRSWIRNAIDSLTKIIKSLPIDGVDVFYEHIDATPKVFTKCLAMVITKLRENRVIQVASISPSYSLNRDYYFSLYNKCPGLIDWVDYQFQTEKFPVFAPDNLVERYMELGSEFYPRQKLIAGYSAENEDWATLSPIVFFLGGMDILTKRNGSGVSILYHNYYKEEAPIEE